MKIRMLGHYHGRLTGDVHLLSGNEYDLPDQAANELIDRGKAAEVRQPKLPAVEKIETVPAMKPRVSKK